MIERRLHTFKDICHHRFLAAQKDVIDACLFLHDGTELLIHVFIDFQDALKLVKDNNQFVLRCRNLLNCI